MAQGPREFDYPSGPPPSLDPEEVELVSRENTLGPETCRMVTYSSDQLKEMSDEELQHIIDNVLGMSIRPDAPRHRKLNRIMRAAHHVENY